MIKENKTGGEIVAEELGRAESRRGVEGDHSHKKAEETAMA